MKVLVIKDGEKELHREASHKPELRFQQLVSQAKALGGSQPVYRAIIGAKELFFETSDLDIKPIEEPKEELEPKIVKKRRAKRK